LVKSNPELLKELFFKGFIAAPSESEEEFKKRASFLSCKNSLQSLINQEKELSNAKIISVSVSSLDVYLSWILFREKGTKLQFFEAGATYLLEKDQINIPFIEYKKNPFCQLEEVLVHEAIHASRICFKENLFEEILAYSFSKSFLRRFFGPLFLFEKEVFFSLISLFLVCLSAFFDFYPVIFFTGLITIISALFLRLLFLQLVFYLTTQKVRLLFPKINPKKITLFFTDKEFFFFAFSNKKSLEFFIQNRSCLRWQQVFSLLN